MAQTDGEKQKVMMRASITRDNAIRRAAMDLMNDPANPMTLDDVQGLIDRDPDTYNALRPLVETE